MSTVAKAQFTDYATSVSNALDAIGAAELLPDDRLIIIKPNLTINRPPPVTTNVAAAEAVIDYVRAHCDAEVVIGEGCGQGETGDLFADRGYQDLAQRKGIRLIDFNTAPEVRLTRDDARVLKEFFMPAVCVDAFIISLPVLKDHSMTTTSVSMKNFFGLASAPHYRGAWNKSDLHSPSTHGCVVDICCYKRPDLCVVDAAVGLTGAHLHGDPKEFGVILAGVDPVAVDAVGSRMLGHKPEKIKYIKWADGILGSMQDIEVIEV
ncbi:hypothetical protein LCGC14_0181700 [marine sediment metagenome]|uniref:DUF362 domain-containing protein n=1 Tax=marine sediment metagenome TaxID=412755 RepID=A0A0F9X803_9ZZZZ|nr:DUF362 domain-containing protein [Phycisphaerae bacterium]HDZ42529.1 DUF362 domain-containing protein [Phycisphaerae bacterium]